MPSVVWVTSNDGSMRVFGEDVKDMIAAWDVKAGFLLLFHSEYAERVTAIPESTIKFFDVYDYRRWSEGKK